ncbi:HEAT repeat domain-containing protein [Magnetospirillum fulvum]|uniref:HEAT repeat-containing protein n=1 Tax=Magnetospirillum fulvum TaxID=1082 RepID=A0A1H6GQ71_MAGFU|nr:HEAT repeat domain-containing protein [Magnetospirillum fulvum]SEH25599.1 HEAT repeat-containing protein [Magnetospirillum fulvum]
MGLVKGNVPDDGLGRDPAVCPLQPKLLADLASDDPGPRRAAARALAAYPEAATALCNRLEIEPAPSVRAMILTTLIKIQNPAIAARLAALLRSDDVPLRTAVIEALQEMPDSAALHLRTLLNDPDSDVRIFAVNILGALRHADVPGWLAELIREEPHINVCAAAVDALAEIGDSEALADLDTLRARFASETFMSFAIDTATRRIRGQ